MKKKPYNDEYQEKKIIYQEALASYKKNNTTSIIPTKSKKKTKTKKEPCPSEIPSKFSDTWNGPYNKTFLRGKVKGVVFSTLEEAMEEANKRDDCVGVTFASRGYDIRYGYMDPREDVQGTGITDFEDLLYPSKSEISFVKKSALNHYKKNGPNKKLIKTPKTQEKQLTVKKIKVKKMLLRN